jgi:hypothetical protein
MSIALLLGSVMSRVILSVVFLLLFVPAGIVMRLFKKDPLNRSIQSDKESYWINREGTFDPHTLEKQY